jgi:CO dehydrogenase maturation factor
MSSKHKTIAVAGKGGTGKTTTAALIVRQLLKRTLGPILAVDADANDNLGASLGVKDYKTISGVLSNFMASRQQMPVGMTKEAWMDYQLNTALEETQNFDLVVMGRKEGEGCYCYPNSMLRNFLENLRENYKFLVMDNEAGLEHLSRGTTDHVDMLLVVSDHAFKGLRTAATIGGLIKTLNLDVRNVRLVINRFIPDMEAELEPLVQASGMPLLGTIPQDMDVQKADARMGSMLDLPDDSAAVQAVDAIVQATLDMIDAQSKES